MKTKIKKSFLLLTTLALFSCGENKSPLPKVVERAALDLDGCSIGGKNEISFVGLNTGKYYDISKEKSINQKRARQLERKLRIDEAVLNEELSIDENTLSIILSENFGKNISWDSNYTWAFRRGGWDNGYRINPRGASNKTILTLAADPSKVQISPSLDTSTSYKYARAVFKSRIINVQEYNNGGFAEVEIDCDGSGVILSFERTNKNTEPTLNKIEINLSKLNSKNDVNIGHTNDLATGSSAYLCYSGGTFCEVSLIDIGDTKSKVEYVEKCELGVFGVETKYAGDKQWVPKTALLTSENKQYCM